MYKFIREVVEAYEQNSSKSGDLGLVCLERRTSTTSVPVLTYVWWGGQDPHCTGR